jgi:hypothetical protein
MTVLYPSNSSRGGGVVIALASRSKFAQMGLCQNTDKPASGPCARRGSNPFPGATCFVKSEAEHGFLFLVFRAFAVFVFALFRDVMRHVNPQARCSARGEPQQKVREPRVLDTI